MRLGDLDGLQSVYDKLGSPILEEGERLLAEHAAGALAFFEGKRPKGEPLIHQGQGEVSCHLTDRRLIVLVDPSLRKARSVLQLPGEESWTRGMELFSVIQGRGRYYLVLPWSEVGRVRLPFKRKGTVRIPVGPDGGPQGTLVVDRETAGWIAKAASDVA